MSLTQWLSLVLVLILGAMSPGPSLAVVLGVTLRSGARAGYLAALSHGIGIMLYALLTVTGLAVIITRSPLLFLLLQVAGSLYLLWLGIGSLRGSGNAAGERADDSNENPALAGFLVAFLNPKVAVFMLALFSQFLSPGAGWEHKATMVVTALFTDAGWYLLMVSMFSREAFLKRLRASTALIDRVFGILISVVAVTVLVRAGLTYFN